MNGAKQQESELGLYPLYDLESPKTILGLAHQDQLISRERARHLWQLLKCQIQMIQRTQHSSVNFEELYRYGYYIVMHKHGGMLYSELSGVISQHLTFTVQPKILANLNNNFLNIINTFWSLHQTSISMIKDILMYMDRVYIRQNELEDIYTLGINLFKNTVVYYSSIQVCLRDTLLGLVMKERHGEPVDRSLLKKATKMLMVLGNNSPDVYKENFENPLLHQSNNFFREESEQLLRENNASLYLRRVEMRIYEEIERSESCFDERTTPLIVQVVEVQLIEAHMKDVVEMQGSGVVHMIENHLTDDLACMYNLLSRVAGGLQTMFDCISCYIRETGETLISNEESNPISYIQNVLDLKNKFDYYLVNSFSYNKLCSQTITSDFEYIFNLNSKSPEYLSLFIDDKLKKSVKGMSDDDKTILLEKTMALFRFLHDKDMFEQYYKQYLAKRLLLSKTVNEENEKSVIAKFKGECGLQYIRRMEGMFRDMQTSASLTKEFRKHASVSGDLVHGIDICTRVLTGVYWPPYNIPSPLTLPSAPLTAYETFRKYYLSRHCGRQLTLLPQLGSAELEAYFVPTKTRSAGEMHSYTLQVSTYQMCILLLFNIKRQWNFQDLQAEINIPPKDLNRALQPLVLGKPSQRILIKRPDSGKVDISDNFYVNTLFSSKTNRVKIPPLQVKYDADDRRDTVNRINEDRFYEIEAAIMRVMKAQKNMNHDDLINEVIALLNSRFNPSRDTIKTRIEVLIEREYITRTSEDRRVYEYIA